MNQQELEQSVAKLPLGRVQYFETISSTNDRAIQWIGDGVPDLSLLVANEQTAGRGRQGRRWFTPPDSALAFTLILKSGLEESGEKNRMITRMTGLGALAACTAIRQTLHLPAEIKWPNDVLIGNRKVGGVLAETIWNGDVPKAVLLGIGINITAAAVPRGIPLNYPAAALEEYSNHPVNRLRLLTDILQEIVVWRKRLNQPVFIDAWQRNLAYLNQQVQIVQERSDGEPRVSDGKILGLNPDGALRLAMPDGRQKSVYAGEIRIRAVDMSEK